MAELGLREEQPGSPSTAGIVLSFCVTILISSFLIFQVQPLISKYILPWFGGTPGVWTTCMLFFQVVLFGGYAYAHLVIDRFKPGAQAVIHGMLLLGALAFLPVTPNAAWAPHGTENPTWRIVGLLAGSVGLPYFMLSATGPLLQAWFSRRTGHANPYWLYALSNIGSLAGLVTYPFLFERLLPVDAQAYYWSWSFAAFAVCCAGCAGLALKAAPPSPKADTPAEIIEARLESANSPEPWLPPTGMDRAMWFALSASASILLLATTNQVCLDIAVIPFLWVLPLTLYLLTFILCFAHPRWYPRWLFLALFIISVAAMVRMMFVATESSLLAQVLIYFVGLFVCCMVCHGELVRMKPAPRHLTAFYMSMSAGGACGGILVGLVAPYLFPRYIELHIGIAACCLTALLAWFRDPASPLAQGWGRLVLLLLFGAGMALVGVLGSDAMSHDPSEIARARNFYGVLRVTDKFPESPKDHHHRLVNGRILHGMQFVAPEKRRIPTTYYGRHTGVGLIMQHYPKAEQRSVGLVGLGAGTMAAYGNAKDRLRFYEINPDVLKIAQEQFTYLQDCPGDVQVILGDARLSLQNEESHQFDVLVLDAFSSDAIPVHLLTREAFQIYLRHLAPDGVIAIHISNRHFELAPVVLAAVDEFQLQALSVDSTAPEDDDDMEYSAHWILVGRNADVWKHKELLEAGKVPGPETRRVALWSDNFSNVVEILKHSPLKSHTWKEMWDQLVKFEFTKFKLW